MLLDHPISRCLKILNADLKRNCNTAWVFDLVSLDVHLGTDKSCARSDRYVLLISPPVTVEYLGLLHNIFFHFMKF